MRRPFPLRIARRRANRGASSASLGPIAHCQPFVRRRGAPPSMERHSSFYPAGGSKRTVLRRSFSDERGEFHLARDQVRCFEFSVEHQCPRVPPHVAEHKFHWTGESNRVAFAPVPLCLRRLGRPPRFQPRVQHQETAFSLALCVKPQRAGSFIRERDLDLPRANQIGRLCLTQYDGLEDQRENQCSRCSHVIT